jgi:talin
MMPLTVLVALIQASGIIADLDTTIMFATAGTLNREGEESFTDHMMEISI